MKTIIPFSLKLLFGLFNLLIIVSSGKAQAPGDNTFNSSQIHEIDILITTPMWWDSLQYYKIFRDTTDITTYMDCDVIINGETISNSGIRLKGNSSYGYPGMKKPIKLKFNEFVSGQKMDGLKKINLNNNLFDPTHMREKLFLDFLNEQGLPAPRCTYARVSYNGEYVGLYKLVEQVDKTFLDTRFGDNDGNLFKGDPGGSLLWFGPNQADYESFYELKTNEAANDWSDLLHFIDNVNNTSSAIFPDSLEASFNVTPFIRAWAANNVFVNLDSYFHAPHNYYLYHNQNTNKFEWVSWDVSVVFGFFPFMTADQTINTDLLLSNQNGPLVSNMLANTNYYEMYLETVCEILHGGLNSATLASKIDSIADAIWPAIQAEPTQNQMFPSNSFYPSIEDVSIALPPISSEIPALKTFIMDRAAIVQQQLDDLGWSCTTNSHDLSELDDIHLRLYPNPATDYVMLEGTGANIAEVEVYDLLGQNVTGRLRFVVEGETKIRIDLSDLVAGVYLIRLASGVRMVYKR